MNQAWRKPLRWLALVGSLCAFVQLGACGGGGSATPNEASAPPTPAGSDPSPPTTGPVTPPSISEFLPGGRVIDLADAAPDRLLRRSVRSFDLINRHVEKSPDGNYLYASVPSFAPGGATIARISLANSDVSHSAALTVDPHLVVVSGDGSLLYVGDANEPRVALLRASDLAVLDTFDLAGICYFETDRYWSRQVDAIAVSPVNPNRWAVSCSNVTTVLDGGVPIATDRKVDGAYVSSYGSVALLFSNDGSSLYGMDRYSPPQLRRFQIEGLSLVLKARSIFLATSSEFDPLSSRSFLSPVGDAILSSGGTAFNAVTLEDEIGQRLLVQSRYSSAGLSGGCRPLEEQSIVACFDSYPVQIGNVTGVPGIALIQLSPYADLAFFNVAATNLGVQSDSMYSPYSRIVSLAFKRLAYGAKPVDMAGNWSLPSSALANGRIIIIDYSPAIP